MRGPIEARLLPSPRLQLNDVQVGPDGAMAHCARGRCRSNSRLSPLLRGEWRADDMRIVGPELHVGIDQNGQLKAPPLALDMDPDALSIDRLGIEDGKVVLSDAASGAEFQLDKLWFNGELRSLIGPIKGEGAATFNGALYPFRLSTGRTNADGALRLHLNVDPTNTPLNIEADGTISAADGKPQFQGTWSCVAAGRNCLARFRRGGDAALAVWRQDQADAGIGADGAGRFQLRLGCRSDQAEWHGRTRVRRAAAFQRRAFGAADRSRQDRR